jgi:hypothetical protein
MSINIVEEVQKRLHFPELEKVSPNAGSENRDGEILSYPVLQGCVVAALTGLYKITRSTPGCVKLIMAGKTGTWLNEIYGNHLGDVIDHIATYNGDNANRALCSQLVHDAAVTAVRVLHEQLADNINVDTVKDFMSDQRDNILVFLPAKLELGKMLNDESLDDNTNKMEGPLSSLMHKIENIFSESR